jgi:hypothetical protein
MVGQDAGKVMYGVLDNRRIDRIKYLGLVHAFDFYIPHLAWVLGSASVRMLGKLTKSRPRVDCVRVHVRPHASPPEDAKREAADNNTIIALPWRRERCY